MSTTSSLTNMKTVYRTDIMNILLILDTGWKIGQD